MYMLQALILLFVKIEPFLVPLMILVFIIKLVAFLKLKPVSWNFTELVFVKTEHIVKSKSFEKVSVKIMQNYLTFYVIFLFVLKVCVRVYTKR